ncbi:MAG: nucleoside triphosphate pyrophosphatase [Cyanobacteria bacterium P01_D01_bin.73]
MSSSSSSSERGTAKKPNFVLASASPARRRLLAMVGIDAAVCPSNFDESQITVFDPGELVQVLAKHKAATVAERLRREVNLRRSLLGNEMPGATVVMGCDSVLLVNGEVYGKPQDPEDAIARWKEMRGQVGSLYTGHVLFDVNLSSEALGVEDDNYREQFTQRSQLTRVHFGEPSDDQISAYVATGEPLQCAGCFALEGKGGMFVEKLEGCHTNVIGLSLPLLHHLLADLGYDATAFWA